MKSALLFAVVLQLAVLTLIRAAPPPPAGHVQEHYLKRFSSGSSNDCYNGARGICIPDYHRALDALGNEFSREQYCSVEWNFYDCVQKTTGICDEYTVVDDRDMRVFKNYIQKECPKR